LSRSRANSGQGKSSGLERNDILPFLEESVKIFDREMKEYSKFREIAEHTARWVYGGKAAPPQFKILDDKPLGRGTYGKVDRAQEASTGQQYALKRIATGSGSSQVSSADWVKNEINIMRKLTHHHITTLAFSTQDHQGFSLYILPVAECNLGDFLERSTKSGKYTEKQAYMWFGCLVSALDYAHRSGVVHKDIKPANILIDKNGDRILLTDFGLAKDLSAHGITRTTGPLIVGTPKYLAPECTPEGERTDSVDIFALGCVYAEILSSLAGRLLGEFDKERLEWGGVEFRCCLKDVKHWLKQKDFRSEGKKHRIVGQTCDMLAVDAIDRPKAADILEKFSIDGLRCASCPR
jgi:serine/threonine protein kinase